MLGVARIAAGRAALRYRGAASRPPAPVRAQRGVASKEASAVREDIAQPGDGAAGRREKLERREWRERLAGEELTAEKRQTQLKKERDVSWKEDVYE